jgi:aspartate/methionine/tyrosine aminotransferase
MNDEILSAACEDVDVMAPYMRWAKARRPPEFDLAGSNVLACGIEEIAGARDALELTGHNDDGYPALVEAIAGRYGVPGACVATAQGASGANFLAFAALLRPGDEVLIERPAYDPLLGIARLLGARVGRFDRTFDDSYALDPDRVTAAMTPRTRLIVITSPHNPSGVVAEGEALETIGRIAAAAGAHVLVDEVYLDAALGRAQKPAATRGEAFVSTSSLTKSYGLAGLRCGWALASPGAAERIRRVRDVVDGTGSVLAERLAALAFQQLDRLAERARRILEPNAARVRAFLDSRADLECVPSGGTVVFPRLRGQTDAEPLTRHLLEHARTALVPGRFFESPAHFRLGFGGAPDRLAGGLAELERALDGAWR